MLVVYKISTMNRKKKKRDCRYCKLRNIPSEIIFSK